MTSQQHEYDRPKTPLYPEVIQSNPEAPIGNKQYPSAPSSSHLYPSLDMHELVENLFPEADETYRDSNGNNQQMPSAPAQAVEETLIQIPGVILNLIDKSYSVELACGDLKIVRIRQGNNTVVILASVADEIQWPLTKDGTAVKLDDSHYFFTLSFADQAGYDSDSGDDKEKKSKSKKKDEKEKNKDGSNADMLNYGVTIASKGQENLLKEFDGILQAYSSFSVQTVSEKAKEEVLDGKLAKETSPKDLKGEKKEMMEKKCAAYWTTLAPNVEDYSGSAAKMIATGSGQLIKGILWCGDVTVDRLKWGNEVLKKRMTPGEKASEVSPETLRRIKRVKRMSKMTEKAAKGVLSGVVKVSGFFTSSVVNSKAGKKFFSLLPGEIVLATLDGFNKLCDAVEVAGKTVMSTSSNVTTELVSHKYGDKAAEATNEGLGAAGHAIGTAWTAFKIRKALNPKSVVKPTTLAKNAAKAAAAEVKAKKSTK